MNAHLPSTLFALAVSCFFLTNAAAQTVFKNSNPGLVPSHFIPVNSEKVHLADFGLYESYLAEAEGIGMALIVKKGGLAAQAGLQTGSILTAVNDKPVRDFQELRQVLATLNKGIPIRLRYLFENQEQEISLELPQPVARIYSFQVAECYGLDVDNYQQSENGGVVITNIKAAGNGAVAGLQVNDIIVGTDEYPVSTWSELYPLLQRNLGNTPLPLIVLRRGKPLLLQIETVDCDGFQAIEAFKHNLLGIQQSFEWRPGTEEFQGILIGGILVNSPAALAGLKPGDRLIDVDGITILSPLDLIQAVANRKANKPMQIQILRDKLLQQLNISPAAPAEPRLVSNWKEENALQPQTFRVFPNPNSGLFTLEFAAAAAPVSIRLFNMNGSLLFSEQNDDFQGSYSRQFDFRAAASGPLVVRIEQGGKVFSKMVLVE